MKYIAFFIMVFLLVSPVMAAAEVNVSIEGTTVIGRFVATGATIWSGTAGTDDSRTINETLNNASAVSTIEFTSCGSLVPASCAGKEFKLTKQITTGKSLTLMNASGANATFNLTGLSDGEAGFLFTGSLGTATKLTSDVAAGANSFTVTSASGIDTNKILYVYDDAIWSSTYSTRRSGELHKIASVVGTTVTLDEPIITGYTTANNAYAQPATPVNASMTNLYLFTVTPTESTDGLKTNYARDVNFSFMRMEGIGRHGASFWNTINVTAQHNEITGARMTGEGYGLSATDASANLNFSWNNITNCRHPVAVDGTGSSSLGQVRNITVADSLLKAWINDADASYALDSHTCTLSMTVRNVTLYKGSEGSTATAGIGAKVLDFQNVTIFGNGSTGYGLAPRGVITDSFWHVRNVSFNGVDLGFYPFTSGGADWDYIYFHDSSGSSSPYLYLGTLSAYTLIDTDQMKPFVGFSGTIHTGTAPLSLPLTSNSSIIKIDSYKWNLTNVTGNNTQVTVSTADDPTLSVPIGNWTVQLNVTNEAGTNSSAMLYWVNVSAAAGSSTGAVNITYNRYLSRAAYNSTWFDLRNGSGTSVASPSTVSYSGLIDTGNSPVNQDYYRMFFYAGYVNVSEALPAGFDLESGTLTVYGADSDMAHLGEQCALLVDLHPASTTYTSLVAADYSTSTYTELSDDCNTGAGSNTSHTYTLNAAGLAYINKTGATAVALMSNRSARLENFTWASIASSLSSRTHHRPLDYLNGSFTPSFSLTYHVDDVVPPDNPTGFTNTTGATSSTVSWTNTGESDFNHTYVLWDGLWVGNLSNVTATYTNNSLVAGTEYTLSAKSCDVLGNCNPAYATHTVLTGVITTAAFSGTPTNGATPLTVTFTDASSETPTGWSWAYKNATVGWTAFPTNSTEQNPVTTFVAGTYDINLSATNAYGSDDEIKTGYIIVLPDPPVTEFSGNDTALCMGDYVAFTDASTNLPDTWLWEFGDGNTSTSQNPTFQYNVAGSMSVNFWANNTGGGDWENKSAYISVVDCAIPVAAFSANDTSVCAGDYVAFTDASTKSPSSWYWMFGDGNTSILQNPVFQFNVLGTKTVNMSATNAFGIDWENKSAYVSVIDCYPPVASFTGSNTSVCIGDTVTFTDTSTHTPSSWYWMFGDGNTSALQSPAFQFNVPGLRSVFMKATNAYGFDWENKTNYVTVTDCTAPIAAFTVSDTTICNGDWVTFTDLSTFSPTSWYWEFGDGNTSVLQNPSHHYMHIGTATVRLKATSFYGFDWENKTAYITMSDCTVLPATGTIVTEPATDVTSKNLTLHASSATGSVYWQYGTHALNPLWVTENVTAGSGLANITESGMPLMSGTKFYFRACDSSGCGAELNATLLAVTPAPTSTFGKTAHNISVAHLDPLVVAGSLQEPYIWSAGTPLIVFSILLFFVFTGLWLRQREVILPILAGLIGSGMLFYAGTNSVGVSPEFLIVAMGIIAVGLTGVITGMLKR